MPLSLEPFVAKLAGSAHLTQVEVDALMSLRFAKRHTPAHQDVIARGEQPSFLYVVLDGWAGRYNIRPDGRRRITGLMLPGDFCGIHAVCHAAMDHGIAALTACTLGLIQLAEFEAVASSSRAIDQALWHAKLVDEAILRMWLLNSADAGRTLAHFFCELDARLHPGRENNERFLKLPLTQVHIGDALGLTAIHVNRTIRQLREAGLVDTTPGTLHIRDVAALRRYASFDPMYLHQRSPSYQPLALKASV